MTSHLRLITDHDQQSITIDDLVQLQTEWKKLPLPAFQGYAVDLEYVHSVVVDYQKYTNVIIIANGGSRTSALAYWQSLAHLRNDTTIEFLSTMEPDVIQALHKKYSPDTTLVLPISKSGTNIDVLEPLFQFLDYPIVAVTSLEKGVLYELAKQYNWPIVPHPEVGGRYSGRTECAFAPAELMGLDVAAINTAAVQAYDTFGYAAPVEDNIALQAAYSCWKNDQAGYTEIFMPIYSQALAGFLPLIVQLIHESTGKDGKGQTIFGDQAPESQHHTNQRFFGGRKNAIGFFMTLRNQRTKNLSTVIPDEVQSLALRDGTLADIHGIPLQDGLRYDYEGVAENATALEIPHLTLEVNEVSETSIGELISFWHYYTVYSALLRDQDPFDQPEVEDAKAASFAKRQTANN